MSSGSRTDSRSGVVWQQRHKYSGKKQVHRTSKNFVRGARGESVDKQVTLVFTRHAEDYFAKTSTYLYLLRYDDLEHLLFQN